MERLNLNTASYEEIAALGIPGLGVNDAKLITEYRENNAAFLTWEEVMDVPGMTAPEVAALRKAGVVLAAGPDVDAPEDLPEDDQSIRGGVSL